MIYIYMYSIAVDQSDDIEGDRTPSTLVRIRVRGDHGSGAVVVRTREVSKMITRKNNPADPSRERLQRWQRDYDSDLPNRKTTRSRHG